MYLDVESCGRLEFLLRVRRPLLRRHDNNRQRDKHEQAHGAQESAYMASA